MRRGSSGISIAKALRYLEAKAAALHVGVEEYSILYLPDTQYITEDAPEVWTSITDFIESWGNNLNLVAVVGLGDITDNGNEAEYTLGAAKWAEIRDLGYVTVPTRGNHDVIGLWDTYFPPAWFSGKTYYKGEYDSSTSNYYVEFSAGGTDYLLLVLDCWPTAEMITWANGIVAANPTKTVIVETHGFLNPDGSRCLQGETGHPTVDSLNYDGQMIWDEFVKLHENILMVVSGHETGYSYRGDYGDEGNPVHQMMWGHYGSFDSDYHFIIMTFSPSAGTFSVTSWGPYVSMNKWSISYVKDLEHVPVHIIGNPVGGTYPSTTGSAAQVYWQSFVASESKELIYLSIKAVNNGECRMAIYTDAAGLPSTLLAYSLPASVSYDRWNDITLVESTELTEGTAYWIAFQMKVNGTVYRADTGGTTKYKAVTYTAPFPATAPGSLISSNADWAVAGFGI